MLAYYRMKSQALAQARSDAQRREAIRAELDWCAFNRLLDALEKARED